MFEKKQKQYVNFCTRHFKDKIDNINFILSKNHLILVIYLFIITLICICRILLKLLFKPNSSVSTITITQFLALKNCGIN